MRYFVKLATAVVAGAGILGITTAAFGVTSRPPAAGPSRTTAAVTVAPVISCGQLANLNFSGVPDAPTVVMSAQRLTGSGPPACQVVGYIAPQEEFVLTLPVSGYAGRYLQQGCGGLCGQDYLALAGGGAAARAAAASCRAAAARVAAEGDLATGTDNQGHVGGETDGVWAMDDPALRVSFGYASEHALAQAAKAIIAAYYGKPPGVLLLRRLFRRRP